MQHSGENMSNNVKTHTWAQMIQGPNVIQRAGSVVHSSAPRVSLQYHCTLHFAMLPGSNLLYQRTLHPPSANSTQTYSNLPTYHTSIEHSLTVRVHTLCYDSWSVGGTMAHIHHPSAPGI